MIAAFLQDAIEEELRMLFRDFKLINAQDELANINFYQQFLPPKQEEDDESHFPFILIEISNGEIESFDDVEIVDLNILFGAYDESNNKQGYKDILNMITKAKQHFMHKHIIERQFELSYPMNWAISVSETYPFYYGGLETRWKINSMSRKESKYV